MPNGQAHLVVIWAEQITFDFNRSFVQLFGLLHAREFNESELAQLPA